jgi:glutamate-1-semialdehyde 2,1-aminomutase
MKDDRMPASNRSQAFHDRGQGVLAGGVSSNFRYGGYGDSPIPLYYERGEGSRLWDVDGNSAIDYAMANGPTILGHAPPTVLEAVKETLSMGQLFAGQTELELQLAERIVELVPCAELVRFASSGTEAIQAALRLVRAATGRKKIIKFEGHYHGWLDNVFVSVNPPLDQAGPVESPKTVPHTPGQAEGAFEDIIVLPWNDLDLFASVLDERGDEIAGVIMEPINCNTGSILPRPGYLEGVRALTEKHGVVLIFDEVVTGFRVGLGGAQGMFGVTPDLAIFAKALAAGFPLAALVGRRDLMERFKTEGVMHGGTYNAGVMVMAAGLATLEALSANHGEVYETMARLGERLMQGLRDLAKDRNIPFLVQGIGPVFHPAFTDAREICDYRAFAAADAERRLRFCAALHNHGVRITARGTWLLSTAHTDADVDETLVAAAKAFDEMP